jgi:DNA-binding transcriptional MocR family regulator
LHAVADVVGIDAVDVGRECSARGVEITPLSAYVMGRQKPANAIVLGFASVRPEAIRAGTEKLAEAVDAARRQRRVRSGGALR